MAITYFKKDGRTHQTVHNHTYEPNLITESGWALDLGCNDFIISRHLLSLGLRVIGIDPINNLSIPYDLKNSVYSPLFAPTSTKTSFSFINCLKNSFTFISFESIVFVINFFYF